jgi:multidrug efflux pump subunit AcrA (membrane-fusion protein)
VARIYAVDYAEVRLPLRDADAAFVDLPIAYRDDEHAGAGPEVWLHAHFAGQRYSWRGRIVRTEGELDPRTRMIHAVARVEDPYGRGAQPDRPPLSVGMFVEAEILGREVDDVMVIPRSALRGEDRVVVVDSNDRLRLREVDVLQRNRDSVLVRGGLAEGERVCTSPLSVSVDGMAVRTLAEPAEQLPATPAPRSAA